LVSTKSALFIGWILTPILVTVFEIRAPSRKLKWRERNNANSSTISKESKDPISFLILVSSTALVHVDPHTDLMFAVGCKNTLCWRLVCPKLGNSLIFHIRPHGWAPHWARRHWALPGLRILVCIITSM
jgi:hypothetical protein